MGVCVCAFVYVQVCVFLGRLHVRTRLARVCVRLHVRTRFAGV